jgi:hypothetical protein
MKTSKATRAAIKRERRKFDDAVDRHFLGGLSHQPMTRQRGFKGSKTGPASAGRTLSADERAAIEARMREAGTL